ncbi:MAG: hypothetical protein AAB837_01015 [Patescibacteria group bacterium]
MSYEVFDPPEYPEDTKEVIRSLKEYLMERNSSLFSVEELRKFIIPYDPMYSEQYKEWLLATKRRVDIGIPGGKQVKPFGPEDKFGGAA